MDSTGQPTGNQNAGVIGGMAVAPLDPRGVNYQLLYVANVTGNSLDVYWTANGTLYKSLYLGTYPNRVAVSSDGTNVAVSLNATNTVAVVNTQTWAVTTVPVGTNPMGVAFNPLLSLQQLAVCNPGSNSVTLVNTTTLAVDASINFNSTMSPWGIAYTSNGTLALVTTKGSTSGVTMLNMAARTFVWNVTNTNVVNPGYIAIMPDDSFVYMTSEYLSTNYSVVRMGVLNKTFTRYSAVATLPYDITISSDGAQVFCTSNCSVPSNKAGTSLTQIYVSNGTTSRTMPFYNGTALASPPSVGAFGFSNVNVTVNDNASSLAVTVNRTGNPDTIEQVSYGAIDGTAVNGVNYTLANGTLTFLPTVKSMTFNVSIAQYGTYDIDRNFQLILFYPTNGSSLVASNSTANITIMCKSTAAPVVQFNLSSYTFNETNGTAYITVTKSGATNANALVNYTTANVTAFSTINYQAASGQLVFLPGDMSKTLNITLINDRVYDGSIYFNVQLASPNGSTGNCSLGTNKTSPIYINETDPIPIVGFNVSSCTVNESDGSVILTVTKNGTTSINASVNYTASNGTAKRGTNFNASSGRLTFTPSQTSQSFQVPLLDDGAYTSQLYFYVNLTNPVGDSIATPGLTVYEKNVDNKIINQSPITNSLNNTTFVMFAAFTNDGFSQLVSLNSSGLPTGNQNAGITSGMAVAPLDSRGSDYQLLYVGNVPNKSLDVYWASNGTVYKSLGLGTYPNRVAVSSDGTKVAVTLNSTNKVAVVNTQTWAVTNITVGTNPMGVAFNPLLSLQQLAVCNPGSNSVTLINTTTLAVNKTFSFNSTMSPYGIVYTSNGTLALVTIKGNSSGISMINMATRAMVWNATCTYVVNPDYIAITPDDQFVYIASEYLSTNYSVVRMGVLNQSFTRYSAVATTPYDIVVSSDGTQVYCTSNGSFPVNTGSNSITKIYVSNGTITRTSPFNNGTALASPPAVGSFGFANLSMVVNDNVSTLTVMVNRSGGLDTFEQVSYGAIDGTATNGANYTLTNGTLTFLPAVKSMTFNVSIIPDPIYDLNRTFQLNLYNPTNGSILIVSNTTANVTIICKSKAPPVVQFNVSNYTYNETNGSINITVTKTGATNVNALINYSTANGTAYSMVNYQASNGQLVFQPTDTNETFTINLIDDGIYTNQLYFYINLSLINGASNCTLGTNKSDKVYLNDSDFVPVVQFNATSYTCNESDGNITINVTKIGTTNVNTQINYTTVDGTAVSDWNYQPTSGTLTFTPNQTYQKFTVPLLDDSICTPQLFFTINLSNATACNVTTPSVTVYENNVDSASVAYNDYSFNQSSYSCSGTDSSVTLNVVRNTFSYVTPIIIDAGPNSQAGTYQYEFDVYNTNGTSAGNTVFLNGHSQNFPNDVRFTNNNGNILQYSLASNNSTYASYYVNVESIPAWPRKTAIYLCYGSSTAQSAAVPGNTGSPYYPVTDFEGSLDPFHEIWDNVYDTNQQAYTGNYSAYLDGTTYYPGLGNDGFTIPSGYKYMVYYALPSGGVSGGMDPQNSYIGASDRHDFNASIPAWQQCWVNLSGSGWAGTINFRWCLETDGGGGVYVDDVYFANTLPGRVSSILNEEQTIPSTASVNYSTTDGTAIAGNNYTSTSGTLNFGTGDTNKTITISLISHNSAAIFSYFYVNLSTPLNGFISGNSTINILNTPVAPLYTEYAFNQSAYTCLGSSSAIINMTRTEFSYSAPIIITGSPDSPLNNYQMRFDVYNTVGVSTGNTIFLNNHSQNFPDDIRFCDANGNSIPYWVDPNNLNATCAPIWVNVSNIPKSPDYVPIFIYYGSPSATSLSNGAAVFPFFDNFSGTSLSPQWITGSKNFDGGYTVNNGLTITGTSTAGSSWDDAFWLKSVSPLPTNCTIYADTSFSGSIGSSSTTLYSDDQNAISACLFNPNDAGFMYMSQAWQDGGSVMSGYVSNTWCDWGAYYSSPDYVSVKAQYLNGNTNFSYPGWSDSLAYTLPSTPHAYLDLESYYPGYYETAQYRDVYVTQLVQHEPTISSIQETTALNANGSVNYATTDGTLTQPSNYTSTTGILTFSQSDFSKNIIVPISTSAPNGYFYVNLSLPVNGTIITPSAQVNILRIPKYSEFQFNQTSYLCNATDGIVTLNVTRTMYDYYVPIVITGSLDGCLNNYQMRFDLYNTTGDNSGNVLFLNGNMIDNWSDIRFIDSNGSQIPYWISSSNASYASVWINVTNIPAWPNNMSICLYYGNGNVQNLSNPRAVFPFFDDFSGTSLSSQWSTGSYYWSGCTTVNNGLLMSGVSTSGAGWQGSTWIESVGTVPSNCKLYTTMMLSHDNPLAQAILYYDDQDAVGASLVWAQYYASQSWEPGSSIRADNYFSDTWKEDGGSYALETYVPVNMSYYNGLTTYNYPRWSDSHRFTLPGAPHVYLSLAQYNNYGSSVAGYKNVYVTQYTQHEPTITALQESPTHSTASVNYETTDGIALKTINYTYSSGTLNYGQLDNYRTFTVPIINTGSTSVSCFYANLSYPINGIINTQSARVDINSVIANFTSNTTTGTAPLCVRFNDTSIGGPAAWQWSFSDGTGNITTQNISHTFNVPGNYTVTLTVINLINNQSSTLQRVGYINVTNQSNLAYNELQFNQTSYLVSDTASYATINVTRNIFNHMVPITINSSSPLNNYQFRFDIYNTTGSNSASTIYLNGNSQNFPNDIRFLENGNSIPYWIESSNSTWASVWVNVTGIPQNQLLTVNLCYGNSNAIGQSNGTQTFLMYDDFNGSSVNTNLWNVSGSGGSVTEANGYLSLNAGFGHNERMTAKQSFGSCIIDTVFNITDGTCGAQDEFAGGKFTQNPNGYTQSGYDNAIMSWHDYLFTYKIQVMWNGRSWGWPVNTNNWYRGEEIFNAGHTYDWVIPGVFDQGLCQYLGDSTSSTSISPDYSVGVFPANSNNFGAMTFDYMLVRNYTTTAPSITCGNEYTLNNSAISVNYSTSDGTAVAGNSYTATTGTLIFNNTSSQIFNVPILNRSNFSWPGLYFYANLNNATGIINSPQAQVMILHTDIVLTSPLGDGVTNGSIILAGYTTDCNVTSINIAQSNNATVATIPVTNGNFTTSLWIQTPVQINVSAIDRTGTLRTTTLDLDGDYLPMQAELLYGFDPLNPDSDSSRTLENESGNGTLDGMEVLNQAGGEKLSCSMKYFLEADPFKLDNNGNGLTDYFEVAMLHDLNISSNSSEEMALPNEDPDNDTLTNIQEQTCGTDPLNPDWDGDGLKDGDEVNTYHTNPFVTDTDTDFLDDGSEISLGMNPLKNSTYDDGILDGLRTYTTTTSNDALGISVSITGTGNMSKKVMITQDTSNYYTNSSALVSPLIHVGVNDSFNNTVLNVKYNQSIVSHPENCSLCYYNATLGVFMPVNSSVDTINHTITANVTHLSLWGVYDAYKLAKLYSKIATFNDQIVGYVEDSPDIPQNIINDPNNPITVTTVYAVDPGTNSVVKSDIVTFSNINTAVLGATPTPVPTASISTNYSLSVTTNKQSSIDWFDGGAWFPTGEYQINASGWYTHWSPPPSELACIDQGPDRGVRMYAWSDRGSNYPYNNVSDADRLGMRVKYGSNDSPVCAVRIQPGTLQINNTGGPIGVWDKDDNYPDDSFQLQYNISYVGPYTPTYNVADSDGDGLPDFVETHGFMDLQGNTYYTKPDNTDSDGDGLYDNQEAGTWTTLNGLKYFQATSDPTKIDSDGDGLTDLAESQVDPTPTNAFEIDSDHDGLNDAQEVLGWYDENKFNGVTTLTHVYFATDPWDSDTDHDGYTDSQETLGSRVLVQDDYEINQYWIYVYNPTIKEPHIDFIPGVWKGIVEGYSSSSPYCNNYYYIEGTDVHRSISNLANVALAGASYLFPAIGATLGPEEVIISEDPALSVIDSAILEDTQADFEGQLQDTNLAIAERGESNNEITSDIQNELDIKDQTGNTVYTNLNNAGLQADTINTLTLMLGKEGVINFDKACNTKGVFTLCPKLADDLNEIIGTDKYPDLKKYNIEQISRIAKTQDDINFEESIPESEQDPEYLAGLYRQLDTNGFNKIKGADGEFRLGKDIYNIYQNDGYEEVISLSKRTDAQGPDGYVQFTGTTKGTLGVTAEGKQVQSIIRSAFKNYIKYDANDNPVEFDADRVVGNMMQALKNDAKSKGTTLSDADAREIAENYWKNPNQEYLIALYGPNGGALKNNLQLDGVEVPYEFVSTTGDKISGIVTIKVVAPDCEAL